MDLADSVIGFLPGTAATDALLQSLSTSFNIAIKYIVQRDLVKAPLYNVTTYLHTKTTLLYISRRQILYNEQAYVNSQLIMYMYNIFQIGAFVDKTHYPKNYPKRYINRHIITVTDFSEESVESLYALVVVRVHPDNSYDVEQLRQEGGDSLGLRADQLLARLTQK